MSHDNDTFNAHQLEVLITDELAHVEASRPDDPLVDSDAGWRPNPTGVKAYEARLQSLRSAVVAIEAAEAAPSPALPPTMTAPGFRHSDPIGRPQ